MANQPRTGHRLIAFEDWRPGEYGVRPASQASPRSFSGLNVTRYDSGLLGPRNGLKKLTLTGSPPTGQVWGFGINPTITAVGAKSVWFVVGNRAYLMNSDGTSVVQCSGTFNASAARPVFGVPQGNSTYVTGSSFNGVYKIDHATEALTGPIAGSPSTGDFITQYGETLLVTGPFNLVTYSAPGDPTSWPALNFFRVGPAGSFIMAAINQRDHLMFSKLEGGWWVMRGSLGQTGNIQSSGTASLRKVSDAFTALAPDSLDVLQDGSVVFVRPSLSPNGKVSALYVHNGSEVHQLAPYIEFSTGDASFYDNNRHQVLALVGTEDFMCLSRPSLGAGDSIIRVNGAFSRHTFDPTGSTFPAILRPVVRGSARVYFCDSGDVAATPVFWLYEPYQRRVAFTSDGSAQPGDDSTTPVNAFFSTYEWLSDAGYEAKVEAVTVDFRSWTTGSASSNHFDVNVITTKSIDRNAEITSTTQSFDDPAGSLGDTSTVGTSLSRRFGFGGTEWGRGFKLKISALRGCAVERLVAHVTVRESRSL